MNFDWGYTSAGLGSRPLPWVLGAVLCVGVLVSGQVGCAGDSATRKVEAAISAGQAQAESQVENARRVYAATPSQETGRTLARAYIDANQFFEAYDLIQGLRESAASDPQNLALLGQTCIGLGLFDQAMSCFLNVLKVDPSHRESEEKLAELLLARADGSDILSVLGEQQAIDINSLSRLQSRVDDAAEALPVADVTPEAQVIQATVTDTCRMTIEVNGRDLKVLFDTGSSGLLIGDDFAARAGIQALAGETMVRGFGDSGFSSVTRARVETLTIGDGVVLNAPVLVVPDLDLSGDSKDYDGVMGPDVLAPYSYFLDRKGGVLAFYPPGTALPQASSRAVTQEFYRLGHQLLTDVAVRNRDTNKAYKVKMLVDTGAQLTLFNRDYAERLEFGQINTTNTVTLAGVANYSRAVEVTFASVDLGPGKFELERFLAIEMPPVGWFVPYGYLGRDVLREFKILVDNAHQKITFDMYE